MNLPEIAKKTKDQIMQTKKSDLKSYKLPTNREVRRANPALATTPSDYFTLKEAYSAVRQVRASINGS